MPDRCRSCKAPIRWAQTHGGHWMRVDERPSYAGTLRLLERSDRPPLVLVVGIDPAFARHTPHDATCPYADQHRRTHEPLV